MIRIDKDNKLKDLTVTDLYMKHVEFIAVNGEMRLMAEKGDASFTAEMTEDGIVVTPDFSLSDFADAIITVTGLEKDGEKVSFTGAKATVRDDRILITLDGELEPGQYTVSFTINSKSGSAAFTVTARAEEPEEPENPETPEQPENPGTPENPEQPENPENPENPEQPENPENPGENNG